MDEQLKQKLMIGALAVLILGAGSYWVFLRDSGDRAQQGMVQGPAERRERVATSDDGRDARRGRESRPQRERQAQEVQRRERDPSEAARDNRRRQRGRVQPEERQKKVSPAA